MAQLDSASDSDSDGWRFESVWVRHLRPLRFAKVFFLLTKRIQYLLLTRLTLRVTIAITFAFAHYKSAWVRHSKTFALCKGLFCLPNGFSTCC